MFSSFVYFIGTEGRAVIFYAVVSILYLRLENLIM